MGYSIYVPFVGRYYGRRHLSTHAGRMAISEQEKDDIN